MRSEGAELLAHQLPQRALVHLNSRTVVVEVEIRQGVCNNPPAEWISPENGWRSSMWPILDHCCKCSHQ